MTIEQEREILKMFIDAFHHPDPSKHIEKFVNYILDIRYNETENNNATLDILKEVRKILKTPEGGSITEHAAYVMKASGL
jgi:hypothetical protein